jgi:hypothetical protein
MLIVQDGVAGMEVVGFVPSHEKFVEIKISLLQLCFGVLLYGR